MLLLLLKQLLAVVAKAVAAGVVVVEAVAAGVVVAAAVSAVVWSDASCARVSGQQQTFWAFTKISKIMCRRELVWFRCQEWRLQVSLFGGGGGGPLFPLLAHGRAEGEREKGGGRRKLKLRRLIRGYPRICHGTSMTKMSTAAATTAAREAATRTQQLQQQRQLEQQRQ